ncbi:MAG: GlcNAc transferase [Planctomycetes bacterium]|nr:GlcNAc transferase [Planctomycetota bacterium]
MPESNSAEQSSATLKPLAGSPALHGERVAFTGTLASMQHRDAFRYTEEHGGIVTQNVSRKTTILVVGEEGWPLEADGQPSQKLRQVLAWQEEGCACRVIEESLWLNLIGLEKRRRDIQGEQTPAMLSQLLDVPVNVIRRWEKMGFIRAVRTVGRLPFFQYQEVAGARLLSQLLSSGIPQRQLESSLKKLVAVLPGLERSLSQLEILSRGGRLLYRDEQGLIETGSGQRCFDFESSDDSTAAVAGESDESNTSKDDSNTAKIVPFSPSDDAGNEDRIHWTAAEWFREGCRLLESNQAASAVEALRLAAMDRPNDAEIHFALAEALDRLGNRTGALERYYAAVETDHDYLEAWSQIGSLHAELGEVDAALQAFDVALSVHSEYPDAHWHKASLLCEQGLRLEAKTHWLAYLKHDSRGPWAETARQKVAECEAEEAARFD